MIGPELTKYVLYVARRIWIVVLVALLLGGGAYFFIDRQPPSYRAEARIFVGNALQPATDRSDVQTSLLLVPTYAEFARTTSVLEATIETLDLDMSVARLRQAVSTRIITDTPILAIRATTSDRQLSADIANEVARNIIEFSPSNLTDDELVQLDILRQQLNEVEEAIATTREQASNVLEQLNEAQENQANEREIEQLRSRYNELVERLNTSRGIVANTSDTYLSLVSRVGRLEIVEPAALPSGSSGFSPILIGAVAAVGGAGLATAGLLLFLEYFDPRIRTELEIVRTLQMPVLGQIKKNGKVRKNLKDYLLPDNIAQNPLSEGYRKIKTNLLFSGDGLDTPNVYLIASPDPKDGRTFTAANLAATIAAGGQRVLLIDADLWKPRIHQIFGLDNAHGTAGLLQAQEITPDAMLSAIHHARQETSIPKLHVITSGTQSEKAPVKVFSFDLFEDFIDAALNSGEYDTILVDSPPSQNVSDAYMIAAASKANVLIVVSYATTYAPDAALLRDQFAYVGAEVKGVILNKR